MPTDKTYPHALPIGTVLAGQYTIEKVLGQGGFGITYRAIDYKTNSYIAVKEFFPHTFAFRERTIVSANPNKESTNFFEYGKKCFLEEAKTLAEFIGCENIVRIHSYFEENGTAYFIMDYVDGTSFDAYLSQRGGKISCDEAKTILIPVMDALAIVHSKGIIHRDVTPDNIYITKDGIVKLLDFGAARYNLGNESRSLDVILKHGFAPKEQYTRHGKQGPYTDVYSLGATFYFAITGRRPPDSIDRMEQDDLIPPKNLGVKITDYQEKAIMQALSVQPQDRFQSMAVFKKVLLNESDSVTPVPGYGQQQNFTVPVLPVQTVQPPQYNQTTQPTQLIQPTMQSPQSVQPNMQSPQSVQPNMQSPWSNQPNMQPPQSVQPNMQSPQSVQPNMQSPQSVQPNMQSPWANQPNMQPQYPSPTPMKAPKNGSKRSKANLVVGISFAAIGILGVITASLILASSVIKRANPQANVSGSSYSDNYSYSIPSYSGSSRSSTAETPTVPTSVGDAEIIGSSVGNIRNGGTICKGKYLGQDALFLLENYQKNISVKVNDIYIDLFNSDSTLSNLCYNDGKLFFLRDGKIFNYDIATDLCSELFDATVNYHIVSFYISEDYIFIHTSDNYLRRISVSTWEEEESIAIRGPGTFTFCNNKLYYIMKCDVKTKDGESVPDATCLVGVDAFNFKEKMDSFKYMDSGDSLENFFSDPVADGEFIYVIENLSDKTFITKSNLSFTEIVDTWDITSLVNDDLIYGFNVLDGKMCFVVSSPSNLDGIQTLYCFDPDNNSSKLTPIASCDGKIYCNLLKNGSDIEFYYNAPDDGKIHSGTLD